MGSVRPAERTGGEPGTTPQGRAGSRDSTIQSNGLAIIPFAISLGVAWGSARCSRLPVVGDQSRHRQRRSRSLRGALVVKGDRGDVRFATADSLAEKLPEIPREKRVA